MCSERLGNWWLYFGSEARIQIGRCVCLVGLAADVESAEPVRFAELERSYALGGLDGLLDYTDRLVGRFLVLVEDDGGLSVVPDGWGSLQAFWANSRSGPSAVSSSPGLLRDLGFGALAQCDRARSRNEAQAKALEYRSVGDLCPISGTRRVRSNHVLELSVGRAARLPLRHRRATFEEVTAELGRAIRGLQLAHGGESWLPITAGLDSRWLAVAASVAGAEPLLFTFTPDHEPTPDATIGAEIADRLGAEHANIALPERVSQSVRDDVTAVRGAWRDLPKMAEIEYLSSLGKRILVLNGNGGEIVRGGYYGTGPRPISRRLVRSLCLGPHPSTFYRDGSTGGSPLSRPYPRSGASTSMSCSTGSSACRTGGATSTPRKTTTSTSSRPSVAGEFCAPVRRSPGDDTESGSPRRWRPSHSYRACPSTRMSVLVRSGSTRM